MILTINIPNIEKHHQKIRFNLYQFIDFIDYINFILEQYTLSFSI